MGQIEITSSFTGTISTGDYENLKPLFSLKETIDEKLSDEQIIERQKALHKICRALFEDAEKESMVKKIEKMRKDIRFYPPENYPSVTSIIGWDADFYISPDELMQYAARGTIIHKQVEIYIKTNEWKDPKDIPEIYPELVILKKGSLGLSYDDVDFLGFLKKYPIKFLSSETTVKNHDYRYAGRQDFKGVLDEKVTLFDIKTGNIDETKAFKQLTAYWNCPGNEDVEQIAIIPLNNKTQQGYSKPKICDNKEKYWSLFMADRENFKKRFGI